jgi:hypothetical protein
VENETFLKLGRRNLTREDNFRLSSWNLHGGLQTEHSLVTLGRDMERRGTSIACLQETHRPDGHTWTTQSRGRIICLSEMSSVPTRQRYGLGLYVAKTTRTPHTQTGLDTRPSGQIEGTTRNFEKTAGRERSRPYADEQTSDTDPYPEDPKLTTQALPARRPRTQHPPLQDPRYTSNGNASALNRRPAPTIELSVTHDLPPSYRETATRTFLHLLFLRFKRHPDRDRSDYCTLMSCKVTKTTTTRFI